MTEWRGGDGAPVQGMGQRLFVLGNQDVSILELKQITIAAPQSVTEVASYASGNENGEHRS
jgi:protein involved in temperature-dependent protein secretion